MRFLMILILQIAVILVVARVIGWVFRRIHQPQVVGEMVAGILLGPSLLGVVAPGVSAALFPPDSLGYLNALSQVGLVLFMFLVGLEFDPRLLRGRSDAAIVTSHVSIIAPFFLGAALALYLYPRLSDRSVDFTGFALFMGAAMSVTAFPVLARILTERNLLHTRVGALTIACAAVDDVSAWTILAVVVAIVRSAAAHTALWLTLFGTLVYVAVMLLAVRPAFRVLESFYRTRGRLTQDMVAGVLLFVLASAWTTEWLGIHALFGAFAAGAALPRDRDFAGELREKLEDVTVVLLLPLFFAFTGLRTSVGLVSGMEMWLYAGLVLLVAVAGKFGGSALAARLTALSWREAGALGILMNTRGLMELVILSIGLDLGVISPALFTMMVLMALVTTFMTTPVLEWMYPARRIREVAIGVEGEPAEYAVLIPIALPSAGPGLLDAALALVPADRVPRIYALHLERASEGSLTEVRRQRRASQEEALRPLLGRAEARGVPVRPLAFMSRDVGRDIVEVAHAKQARLILLGWHKPIVGRGMLGGTVAEVMKRARADVVVYVERHGRGWRRILVPYLDSAHDRAAIEVARRLSERDDVEVTVLHVVRGGRAAEGGGARVRDEPFPESRVRLRVVEGGDPLAEAVREAREGYDLIVVGVSEAWGLVPAPFGPRHERLARETSASLLVVRSGERVEGPSAARPAGEEAARGATA